MWFALGIFLGNVTYHVVVNRNPRRGVVIGLIAGNLWVLLAWPLGLL